MKNIYHNNTYKKKTAVTLGKKKTVETLVKTKSQSPQYVTVLKTSKGYQKQVTKKSMPMPPPRKQKETKQAACPHEC